MNAMILMTALDSIARPTFLDAMNAGGRWTVRLCEQKRAISAAWRLQRYMELIEKTAGFKKLLSDLTREFIIFER